MPKQIKENGVKDGELNIKDGTIKEIIRSYTRRVWCKKFRKRDFKNNKKSCKKSCQ